jgi:hypothetical protein
MKIFQKTKIKKGVPMEQKPQPRTESQGGPVHGRCPLCHQQMPTKIPRNEIQKVVFVFKIATGHDPQDKAWDQVYYPRYMKPAKELIAFLGDWRKAGNCIQDIYEKFTNQGLSCTMETIVRHAATWKKDQQEKEAKPNGVLPLPRHGNLSFDR